MQPEWEIWLDCNLSPIIAKWMKEFTGWNVKSSFILQFSGLNDLDIYNKAKKHGNVILISKDTDFPELISRLGYPPKLIKLQIGNCDNKVLWDFLKKNIKNAIEILTTSDIAIIELD